MKIDESKIKNLRHLKKWSQEQLSDISGLSLRTIQRVENGSNVSLETLKMLANALGVDANELMIQENKHPTTPIEAVKKGFVEVANFSGKASRYEYWWFVLFMVLVMAVATIIHDKLNQIVSVLFLLPFFAVGTRRLNDIGKSPWWQLFMLVPFGQIIVFYLMAQKGEN